jgi:hypothetical protein
MHKKILPLLAGCMLAVVCCYRPALAQLAANEYTLTRRAELSLLGDTKSYGYTVDQMEGRFNRKLSRFEFRLPLEAVRPVRNAADLLVFKSVFLNNPEEAFQPADFVQLWVYMPENTRNFDNFRNARTITLEADFVVNGNVYRTPVAMNLFYSAGILKYGLDMSMNPAFAAPTTTGFSGGPLRKLQMLVRESEMNVAFNE